jgi:hypothetical protein
VPKLRLLCRLAALIAIITAGAFAQPVIYGSAYLGPNSPASFYQINPNNGSATLIGSIGFKRVGSMDFSPAGTLYAAGQDGSGPNLLTINIATGVGTKIANISGTGGDVFQDIAFRPSDGVLFGYAEGDIYRINLTTGAATLVGGPGGFPDGNGLAFSSANVLYLSNNSGGTVGNLYSINQTNAAETVAAPLSYSGFPATDFIRTSGIKFDASGTIWAAVVNGSGDNEGTAPTWSLGRMNVATGNVTRVGATVSGLDAIAVRTGGGTSVPALTFPAALILCALLGAFALFTLRRPALS